MTCTGHKGCYRPGWNSSIGDPGCAGGCRDGVDDGAKPSTYSPQQPFVSSI